MNKITKYMRQFEKAGLAKLIFGYFLLIFSIFFASLLPQITKLVIDFVLNPTSASENTLFLNLFEFLLTIDTFSLLLILIAAFLGIAILKNALDYASKVVFFKADLQIFGAIRNAEIKKIVNTNKLENEGDAFLNLTYRVYQFADIQGYIIPDAIEYLLLGIASLIFAFLLNWILGIVIVCFVPIFIVINYFYFKASKNSYDKIGNEEDKGNFLAEEFLEGVKDIRSMGLTDGAITQMEMQAVDEFNARKDANRYINRYNLLVNLARSVGYACIVILTGYFALMGFITVGSFVALLAYALTVFSCISSGMGRIFDLQDYLLSARKIQKFTEKKEKVLSHKSKEFIKGTPNISIKKLSFITGGKKVLQNVSFDIEYGKKIGITGTQGSGKSVIGKLLLRLLEPSSGGIMINGRDIKEININSLRGQFSYVPQKTYIFNDTIKSNIVLFDNADEDRLKEVIRVVELSEFIRKQKNKEKEVLLYDGIGVPGQEKEKINLARALYRNSPILLLDAPFTTFDAYQAHELIKKIFKFAKNRTVIILSSNPEDLMLCDEVIFLKDGKLVEKGKPKELVKTDGSFSRAYKKYKEWNGIK